MPMPEFEGREAQVYVRNGVAIRRLRCTSAPTRMKPSHALLALDHPNLVRILLITLDGDMHMQCMQVSLQRHMCPGHACSGPVKLSVARHVTSGIRHLHTHSMQHEDLCPNNVLLAWRHGVMEVRLCDFYSERCGIHRTPAYAAPEVVRGPAEDVTCAADVWAFACCVLFMEGAEPFRGFEDSLAVFFYVATHSAVGFKEDGELKQFSLQHCEYGPARHIGLSMWAPVLSLMFVPEHARLSSQQLHERLGMLEAPAADLSKAPSPRQALKRLNFA